MKTSTLLSSLLLASSALSASSLSVYTDRTFYKYSPENTYVGFAKNIQAQCDGTRIPLKVIQKCPQEMRLCKSLLDLGEKQLHLDMIEANINVLNTLITLPKPTALDGNAWIIAARSVGEEQARLSKQQKEAQILVNESLQTFKKQAPSLKPLQTEELCSKSFELQIPAGQIRFTSRYEADISEKNIEVTHTLSLLNRSGIDINADTATFYNHASRTYIRPVRFDPWVIREKQKRILAVKREVSPMNMEEDAVMNMTLAAPVQKPAAHYIEAREYQINNLNLPSSGLPVKAEVTHWSAALNCETVVYPYRDPHAYNVCSFTPRYQIEGNLWKVIDNEKVVNENAYGEYDEGKYKLYTSIDEDLKIVRKRKVKYERESGIFGSTVRKKDGYTLVVSNRSAKSKTLKIIERIPVSQKEEIKVKLLKVNAEKKVKYKSIKEGKLEIEVQLAANESNTIEIVFEVSYDKSLKVVY